MIALLELKEMLKSFYGRFAAPVDALVKFLVSLSALMLMNGNMGYLVKMKNPLMLIGLALVCAFLPYGAISFLMGMVLLGHIYSVSMEFALLTGIFLVLVALLYYGLQPRDSYWLVLTPIAFSAVGRTFRWPGGSDTCKLRCGSLLYYELCEAECRGIDQ